MDVTSARHGGNADGGTGRGRRDAPRSLSVPLHEERLCVALGFGAVALVLVGVTTNLVYARSGRAPDRVQRFLDVNGEGNLPTWYSVVLLAAAATTVVAMAVHQARADVRLGRSWYLLAALVALMSLDEMVGLHEAAGGVLDDHVDLPVIGKYAWIVPGSVAAAVAARVLLRAAGALSPGGRRRIVAAGAVFVGAALGIEVLEALLLNDGRNYLGDGMHVLTGTQECFEMLGVILFLRAMLIELRRFDAR